MTADYADSLRRAWGLMCRLPSCQVHTDSCSLCEGHAALLEMVDAYASVAAMGGPDEDHFEEEMRNVTRSRLRAAVGAKERT